MINFNQFISEDSIVLDATDPSSKDLLKLLKKHKVSMKNLGEGPSGFDEVELTGDRKSLISVISDEDAGWGDSGLEEYIEEGMNESKIVLKRQYTENHPAITVGKSAKIRNKMLEAIADGKITQEEFNAILKEMSTDSSRWMQRNNKFFNVSEEGISLSQSGKRALLQITVNEKELQVQLEEGNAFIYAASKAKKEGKKEFEFNGKTYKVTLKSDTGLKENKNIKTNFIYESFSEFVNSINEASITLDATDPSSKDLLKLLKKHKVSMKNLGEGPSGFDEVELTGDRKSLISVISDEDAGWGDSDLEEYIEESNGTYSIKVRSLNESVVNEAFASQKLASILTGANKMPGDLAKAFYNMAKIALDKIQDVDIIEMDPATAKKEKRASAVYLYFTTNEKENPYAGRSAWRDEKQIPANTLLAITDGSNEWMATEWQRSYSRDKNATRTLKTTKRDDSSGFQKSGRGEYGSGISSMKQVAELADRAYCLDLTILSARYSTNAQRDERAAAKKGAIAFKSDKDFKAENLSRYNDIIANRASKMPIDKMVEDAIDTISNQIKDGLVKGEKGRYGDIIVGRNGKGSEGKLSDAARHMQNILDDFQRYVNYTNQAEEEKVSGYSGSYYAEEVKNYAKSITDKIKQIDTFGYVW